MPTLSNNIARAIRDFDNIETAIEDMGVEVPKGTPTSSYEQKIKDIEQGITPSGTLEISENGNYDVTNFAEAAVAVPQPSGKITLTENATDVDVSQYATADIAVPQGVFPEGTYEITENGIYDITDYANVDIDVSGDITVNEQYTIEGGTLVSADITFNGEIIATIPDDVTSIEEYVFVQNNLITKVVIPNSVIHIGNHAFASCTNLKNITIPNSVMSIGNYAFEGCSSLTSITIPNSVTSIGSSAFYNCTSLTNLSISDNIATIAAYTFASCTSLESITIPGNITSIDWSAFVGCNGISSIVVDENNSTYDSRNNCNAIIETETDTLIIGCKTSVIPDNVISISYKAFASCSSLESITIPDSVTSIGSYAFDGCASLESITIGNNAMSIDYYAFQDCISLTSVHISDIASWCNTQFSSYLSNPLYYAHNLYLNDELIIELVIPNDVTSIKMWAFSDCTSITNVTIPGSVLSIDYYAFDGCNSLTSVMMDNGITNIRGEVFRNCTSLVSITIPNSITNIGYGAFSGCTSLTDIYYTGTQEQWQSIDGIENANIPQSATIHYNYTPE